MFKRFVEFRVSLARLSNFSILIEVLALDPARSAHACAQIQRGELDLHHDGHLQRNYEDSHHSAISHCTGIGLILPEQKRNGVETCSNVFLELVRLPRSSRQ